METQNQTVCLLVPCYNAEAYLEDFIANVRAQTRAFDEIWFCDDASTDRTREMLQSVSFAGVLRNEQNRGPSVTRNRLIKASKSRLIHFHDVDDWMESNFLEETLKTLTDSYDAVITNIRVLDRTSGKQIHTHDYSGLNTSEDSVNFFLRHCCYPINGLYRRDKVEAIGGFREALTRDEDPDFHIRLAFLGAKIVCLPKPLAINRFGPGTYSSRSYLACWREHAKALAFYETELPSKYRPILVEDAAKMIYLVATAGDLPLARSYAEFCRRNGGEGHLFKIGRTPLRIMIHVFGLNLALFIRFNWLSRKLIGAVRLKGSFFKRLLLWKHR
jgi:glycosyltransferase involved in cell wall biosynthesis